MAHLLAAKYRPPITAQTQAITAIALFIVSVPIALTKQMVSNQCESMPCVRLNLRKLAAAPAARICQRRSSADASGEFIQRSAADGVPSHAVNGEFRIGQVAEARPMRTPEIFAATWLPVDTGQSCDWAVRIDNDNRFYAPKQIASDRSPHSERNPGCCDNSQAA